MNTNNQLKNNELYFAKVKPKAIIPSKREEDGGYDINACFELDNFYILPHTIEFVPTGLATAFSQDYVMLLRERGSTGSKGLSLRCGVVDSGYRDEIFVAINNTTNKTIVITKYPEDFDGDKFIVYPYKKAIVQAVMVINPKLQTKELSYEELKNIKSDRGLGKLGSSNK